MSEFKRIYIVGHPGAGKGVLGKALAQKMGWEFIDTDFGLEFHIGRPLMEILGKTGEKSFHKCESEILISLLNKENIVITTDGGIVCNEKNRRLLSSEFVVYLQVSTAIQLERTIRNAEPFLLYTDLMTFLSKLHEERDHLYKEVARLTINGDDSDLEEHVSVIIKNFPQDRIEKITEKLSLDKKDLVFFHKILHTPIHLSLQRAICLKLLAQGNSTKEIAKIIKISHRTVEKYIAKTAEILGCSSSKELIALYHEHR